MGNIILDALRGPPAPTLYDGEITEPPRDHDRRRGLTRAPIGDETPTVEADEIPDMIRAAATTYLADPSPATLLLIATPAGTGKTTVMVDLAEREAAAGGRVIYAGPNHDFFGDVQALAAHPSWWYEWQARHDGAPETGAGATCRWPHQMTAWLARGYSARGFCSNPRICGWAYAHSQCRYYAQQGRTEPIIYAQHQHVALGHLLMPHARLVIGDELPLSAFLSNTRERLGWIIPPDKILPRGMSDGPLSALLRRLQTLASIPRQIWRGGELLDMLGGAAHVADVCATVGIGDLAEPQLRDAIDVENAPYGHLMTLATLLGAEAREHAAGRLCVERVRVDTSGLTLLIRRGPAVLPPHVIWCDATGDERLYQRLFGRPVTILKPRVKLRGRVFQVWASLNNKGSLLGDGAPKAIEPAALPEAPSAPERRAPENAEKRSKLTQQIKQILSRGYQRPAIISYKSLVDTITVGTAADLGHFGAQRGTNRYQDCDCLIVIGAQQPTVPAMVDTAAMLYADRMPPFVTTWSMLDRPYAGQPWAWPIGGFWDDSDLQTLLEQFRESELIQAIHRARPIRRAVDVWLLTNVPLPGLAVELVSLHQLFGAPEGVDPYRWPAVVAFAQERIDQVGLVTSADLTRAGLCAQNIAAKYIPVLADQQGWQLVQAPANGRGKPPVACVKR